jgi:hypothetical protein
MDRPFYEIETIDALFHDFGKSPFQTRLIKALRHLKPDEILQLLSLDPSETILFIVKST